MSVLNLNSRLDGKAADVAAANKGWIRPRKAAPAPTPTPTPPAPAPTPPAAAAAPAPAAPRRARKKADTGKSAGVVLRRIAEREFQAELKALKAELRAAKKARNQAKKGPKLSTALRGSLTRADFNDIGGLINTYLRKGGQGVSLIDQVSSGTLDEFFSPNNRSDNPNFDEQAAEEHIKEMLRSGTTHTYMNQIEITMAENAIEEIEERIAAHEAAGPTYTDPSAVAEPAPSAPSDGLAGDELANGFHRGPELGSRYRVTRSGPRKQYTMLEKRPPSGKAYSFYVGKNGGLVDADTVVWGAENSGANLWQAPSEASQAEAESILQQMGALALNDPKRAKLREQLKALVTQPAEQADAAAQPEESAPVEEAATTAALNQRIGEYFNEVTDAAKIEGGRATRIEKWAQKQMAKVTDALKEDGITEQRQKDLQTTKSLLSILLTKANNAIKNKASAAKPSAVEEPTETPVPANKAAPKAEDETETRVSPTNTTQEESSTEETTEQPAEDSADTTPRTGLASIFPKLVGGVSNFFLTAFKLRSTQNTRLVGLEDPLGTLKKALSSEAELTAFLGSRASRTLDGDTSTAYAETIFAAMPSLSNAMNARLKPLLAKLNGKKDQPNRKSNLQRLLAGDMDVARMVNSRVLSLVEPDGKGGFQYNSALLGSALLAGAQWMLTANASNPMMTANRAGALIGIKEDQVGYDLINAMSEGIDKQTALAAIAAKISEYWGITPNADVGIGHTRGIPMAMAIEVLASLVATKSIETSIVRVTKSGRVLKDNEAAPIIGFSTDGKNTPIPEVVLELTRFIVPALPKEDPLSRYPDLIDKAVLIDPTPTFFFGNSVPKISNKQKRNRYVPVNPHAQRAMQNFSNVPYFRNLSMEGFFLDGLGLNGMLTVLGNGELSEKVWNKGHFEKVDGQNKAIAFAHDYLVNMLEEHSDAAEAAGVDPADYPIRFGFGSTKVMRFQQEGALTPQGNKTMREMVSPNRAEVNLTDPAALEVFRLSQAQALGISVHNMTRESMMEKLNTLLLTEEIRAGVAVFTKWLETGTELNADDFTDLRKAMGGSPTNVALHAMMEQAKYQAALESNPDALKNFTTHMYVEADGATNGPINSIALLTTGPFTEAYVRNMAMGGLFLGEKGMSLNAYRSVMSLDLYKTAAANVSRLIAELQQEYAGTEVGDQANHVSTLMGLLFGKDWAFNDKDELVIGRNILKNPLTVTVYGAGAEGIANKITSNMLDAIYERYSAALQSGGSIAENMFPGPNAAADFARFNKAMASVISNVVESDKGDLYLESSNASYFPTNMNKKALQNFVFNKGQISAIQENLFYLLVGPIRVAIGETMGESVAASVALLRKGTQVQSLLLAHEFDRLVTARL